MKALRSRFVHSLPPLAGFLSVIVGGLVLIGWATDSAHLKSLIPGSIPMMPNSAIASICAGLSLISASIRPETRTVRLAAGGFAAVTLSIGFVTGWEYLLGMNLGIDQGLFHEPLETVGPWIPGRMGVNTAASFLLLGLGLLLKIASPDRHALSDGCTLGAMLLGFMAFLGYLYREQYLYGVGQYTPMAFHTALVLLLACAGTLALHPGHGVMAVVNSDQAGSYMLRRLLPGVLLILPAIGWIRLHGEREGYYGTPLGVAIFASLATITIAGLLWWTARSMNEADQARRHSDRLFAAFMNHLPALVWIKDAGGRYLYLNEAFTKAFGARSDEWLHKSDPIDAQVIANNKAVVMVETAPYADGVHESLVSKFPIADEEGNIELLGGVAVDITDRKNIETALRESEERFRQVTEHIQEVFWLSDPLKNEILYVSPAYESIWGRTCESL